METAEGQFGVLEAGDQEVVLRLPFPKSVNAHWQSRILWPKRWLAALGQLKKRLGPGPRADVHLTREGRKYQELVVSLLPRVLRPTRDRLSVTLCLRRGDRRGYDIQNYEKGLLDALTKARVWADDGQIDEIHVLRGPVAPGEGHVDVTIRAIDQPQRELFQEQEGQ